MNWLNLTDIKQQCRLDADFTEDDNLLEILGDSAEAFLEAHLNMSLDSIASENGGELPKNLYGALLMHVSYLYDQDGSGKMEDMPNSYFIMTAPFKNYTIA